MEAVDGASTSNAEPQSSKAANMFKAAGRLGTLLSSGGKSAGQPPAIHPPWSKARVRPMEDGDGGRERVEKREGEGVWRALERGVAGRREQEQGEWRERPAGRDEGVERGREGRGRETEPRGRGNRNGITGMRNGGGEVGRGEYRGELPGFPSSHRPASLGGGVVIDGSYFQTSVEAKKPPAVKQKLSEALSLISLSRRLQGPPRVGEGEWRDGKGWDRGEEDRRETNGSIGDMSVSALVSEKSWDSRGKDTRRREREVGEGDRWWKREKTGIRLRDFRESDSESGSAGKNSRQDFSLSETSSPTSSFTAKHDDDSSSYRELDDSLEGSDEESRSKTESDSDTDAEERKTGTKGSQGDDREGSESDREDEEEEGESNEKSSRRSERSSRRSSGSGGSIRDSSNSSRSKRAKKSRSGKTKATDRRTNGDSASSRHSSSTVSSSRPKTSRHSRSSGPSRETTEEESEEDEESGEEGAIDTSNNLSPIIEDTEEEEKSSSPDSSEEEGDGDGGGGHEDEEGLENETAD